MFLKQQFSKMFKACKLFDISSFQNNKIIKKDIIKILLSTNLLRDVLYNHGRMNTNGICLGLRDNLDQLSSSCL